MVLNVMVPRRMGAGSHAIDVSGNLSLLFIGTSCRHVFQ